MGSEAVYMLATSYPKVTFMLTVAFVAQHIFQHSLWLGKNVACLLKVALFPLKLLWIAARLAWWQGRNLLLRICRPAAPQQTLPVSPPLLSEAPSSDGTAESSLEDVVRGPEDFREEVITFGTHRGWTFAEVMVQKPCYILWCARNCATTSNPELIKLIAAALEIGPEEYWQGECRKWKTAQLRKNKLEKDKQKSGEKQEKDDREDPGTAGSNHTSGTALTITVPLGVSPPLLR